MKIVTEISWPIRTGNDRLALRDTLPSMRAWAAEREERERRRTAAQAAAPACDLCGAQPAKEIGGGRGLRCVLCFPRAVS